MATPLHRKLGLKENMDVWLIDAPDNLPGLLEPLPDGCALQAVAPDDLPDPPITLSLLFARSYAAFLGGFNALFAHVEADSVLWICWPKKSSGLSTDLSFDVIQGAALARGLVDNKVCAIDATWSALRFTVRKELRADWDPSLH